MKKSTLITFAASALLVAGCSAPDVAPVTVPQAPAAETVTELDLSIIPSGIMGLSVADLRADADETLASIPEAVPAGQWTGVPEYAASYATAAPTFPADYFTVESFDRPGIIHVYHVAAALRA